MSNNQNNFYIWNVSEISYAIKSVVENSFDFIKVKGEISRPVYPASGHVYFTLKDEKSSLNAIIWKNDFLKTSLKLEDGLEVVCTGKMTTFPGNSKYQIIIQDIQHAGEGALLKQIEERKKRFLAEGLFDDSKKLPIPKYPNRIAIITSPSGAVIQDILHRVEDRWPCNIDIFPVKVQGKESSEEIAQAINLISRISDIKSSRIPDLIIVARGGGSVEDLWSFNDEGVVRAVYNCKIPIISAIGHETDTTLIDYVSDLRAPTPSAAAEIATPLKSDIELKIKDMDFKVNKSVISMIKNFNDRLIYNYRFLSKSEVFLNIPSQRLDYSLQSLTKVIDQIQIQKKIEFTEIKNNIPFLGQLIYKSQDILNKRSEGFSNFFINNLNNKSIKYEKLNASFNLLKNNLNFSLYIYKVKKLFDTNNSLIDRYVSNLENRVNSLSRLLISNNINEILKKGFVFVSDKNGKPVNSVKKIDQDELIKLKFKDGFVDSKVKKIYVDNN